MIHFKPDFWAAVLNNLDEWGTPQIKLPNCPACDEDELMVPHSNRVMCLRCGWAVDRDELIEVAVKPYQLAQGKATAGEVMYEARGAVKALRAFLEDRNETVFDTRPAADAGGAGPVPAVG